MRRTNIYLEDRQSDALDRLAGDEGISRAELIRRIIDAALGDRDDALMPDLDAIRRSAGVFAEAAAPDRGVDGRARHLDELWRRTA